MSATEEEVIRSLKEAVAEQGGDRDELHDHVNGNGAAVTANGHGQDHDDEGHGGQDHNGQDHDDQDWAVQDHDDVQNDVQDHGDDENDGAVLGMQRSVTESEHHHDGEEADEHAEEEAAVRRPPTPARAESWEAAELSDEEGTVTATQRHDHDDDDDATAEGQEEDEGHQAAEEEKLHGDDQHPVEPVLCVCPAAPAGYERELSHHEQEDDGLRGVAAGDEEPVVVAEQQQQEEDDVHPSKRREEVPEPRQTVRAGWLSKRQSSLEIKRQVEAQSRPTLSKAAMSTSVDEQSVRAAYEDVRADTSDTEWAVFKFEEQSVVCAATGVGFDSFRAHFADDERAFGFIRIQMGDEMSKRQKFMFLTWVGPRVSVIRRAKMSIDKAMVKSIIKNFAVELQVETQAEINEDYFREELARVGGANYGTGFRD